MELEPTDQEKNRTAKNQPGKGLKTRRLKTEDTYNLKDVEKVARNVDKGYKNFAVYYILIHIFVNIGSKFLFKLKQITSFK